MKKVFKKSLALFLAITMLSSMFCLFAGSLTVSDMTDYSEDHWAAEALAWAIDNDLIKGYHDSTIRPDAYLTRAEMATVINRAFGAKILANIEDFEDVSAKDWFYDEMAKAVNMGTFEGNEAHQLLPNDNIRREEAFAVIARALVLEGADASALDKFGDKADVSDWAKALLADLAQRGYINGSPVEGQEKNNLYPRNYITRAEFAQLLYNIFNQIINSQPIKGLTVEGNLLVNYNSGNILIDGITVKGDLIIADGVGYDDVTIRNTTIEGRLVIRGGKDYRIAVATVTADGGVVVRNNNTTVNFKNYEYEKLFNGIIAKTPVTFLENYGGNIWVGPEETQVTYKTEYYLEQADGSFKLEATDNYRVVAGTKVNAVIKTFTGYTFDDTNTNNVLTGTASDSLVLKVYYKLIPAVTEYVTVTFKNLEEPDDSKVVVKTVQIEKGTKVAADAIPYVTIEGYSATYALGTFKNEIKNDAWVIFDETTEQHKGEFTAETVVNEDITVVPQWSNLAMGAYIKRIDFTQPLSVQYNKDTRAIDTVKDFIFLKRNAILSAINEKELDDKVVGRLDIIIDNNDERNIKLVEKEICIVETLGAKKVEDMIHDAFVEAGTSADEQELTEFVDALLGVTDTDGNGKINDDDKQVVITDDNIEIVEKYADKIDEIEYNDIKDAIPDAYQKIMTEAEMKQAFEDAKTQYKDEIYEELYHYHDTHPTLSVPPYLQDWFDQKYGSHASLAATAGDRVIRSYVTVKINPVTYITDKYDRALNKFEDKFYDKYDDNEYFKRLIEILSPDALLKAGTKGTEEGFSGYALLSNEAYYDLLEEAVIMADEAGKFFYDKLDAQDREELVDRFAEIVSDNMSRINGLIDDYAERAIDKIADYNERLEKLEEYEDRRLTQKDIDRAANAVKKILNKYDVTTDYIFNKAYNFDHDKIDGFKFDESNKPARIEGYYGLDKGFYKELKGNAAWVGIGAYIADGTDK